MRKVVTYLWLFASLCSLQTTSGANTALNATISKPSIQEEGIKPLTAYPLNSHDISSLLNWGPYSKKYAGISHIPQMEKGLRFDFSVMPGYYRNRLLVPHVLFESSYYPWDFSPTMNRITYRYQLEWKDRLYVDVTYYVLNGSNVLVEINCVNNSSFTQNLMFNNMAYIDYPESASKIRIQGNEYLKWYNAIDYADLDLIKKTPRNNLVYDGWMRNEVLDEKSISRSTLAGGFAANRGDNVRYKIQVKDKNGVLRLRYKIAQGEEAEFSCNGLVDSFIKLKGSGKYEFQDLSYSVDSIGEYDFHLKSTTNVPVQLDGFFLGKKDAYTSLKIDEGELPFTPLLKKGKNNQDFVLKYDEIENYYGVAWNYDESEIRQVLNGELESFFRRKVHNHVDEVLVGDKKWHYTNAFLRPVVIQPNTSEKYYTLISAGGKQSVEKDIAEFHKNQDRFIEQASKLNATTEESALLPDGEKFLFGKKLLQASILSNISYPIYTQREYIRHFTPGKNWNSLYTWDSGFIALGLLDIDSEKAFEVIKAYTTPVGSQSAFIHHGTPLPIQIFACFDLWNMEKNNDALTFLYPRLKQYYDFMAGHAPTSTTRMKDSNLLTTWDYFYNSGGWDDYPPQYYFHNVDTIKNVAPVVSTAFYIRAAKILRMAAKELGYAADMKHYDNDIRKFSDALQKYSWDAEAKYFSYVQHDANGNAKGIYRYPKDASNFNKGLDGVSPLVAGICTKEQESSLIGHIFNKNELWTSSGISTVDQSASYYKNDGYWNGAVWMPHQWTLWKSLLDCGEGEKAYRIAQRALQVWEKECEASYYTFEHFIISSERGAGWHQFSGLSSPIINWFTSYYQIGKVTTGFEIWIEEDQFMDEFTEYTAKLSFDDSQKARSRNMLVCLNPSKKYKAFFNNKEIVLRSYHPGLIELTLPASNKEGILKIAPNM